MGREKGARGVRCELRGSWGKGDEEGDAEYLGVWYRFLECSMYTHNNI